jgi:phytoene desaturase
MRAVVIGAGFGGIAAALRARAKGYDVLLIDRCKHLGGRAQVFERDGYRHDAGPTVLTAPFLFEELFTLFGRTMSDSVQLRALTPWYRFRFNDGDTFDYGGSIDDTLAEISRIHPPDVQGYRNLLEASRAIYQVGFEGLADAPFHRFSDMLRCVPDLVRLGAHRTVWNLVCKHLQHEKIRQAFSIQPLLVGGNPFDTTSIYALIHFLERAHGVHFVMGGTGALVAALERLMRDVGIEIRLEATVTGIDVRSGAVHSVQCADGGHITTDVVISNTDPAHLYTRLLEDQHVHRTARLKVRHARKSMGLFVLYFGAARQWPEVAHHTILIGPRYRGLLDDIFHRKVLADDLSIYLHRPTATDPTFAPAGHDSFYALVPVPNLEAKLSWQVEAPRLRARLIEVLDNTVLPGLKPSLRSDFYMTPEDFEHDYLSPAGAGFSIAPHFTQSAWFRFHNLAEGPRNLFLVGAGTHPGAGMPGVLSSAKVIDRLLPPARRQAAG